MQSTQTTSSAQQEWRRHWPLVLVCGLGIAIAGAHFHVVGAMVRPLEAAYGWTRADVSLAVTIYTLVVPLANVAVGLMADRYGPRRVVLIGSILFGFVYALLGLAGPELWTWYAATAALALIGQGVSPVVWTMAVVRNFSAGRGLALAIALSGAGLMVAVVPSLVLALVTNLGVRGTFVAIAVCSAVLMFVPALFFFRTPADDSSTAAQRKDNLALLPGSSVAQAMRSRQFWQFGLGLGVVASTIGMFIVHFQSMLIDGGLTAAEAARAAVMMGPMMILGRLGTGLLFDRLPTPWVSAAAFGLPALACLMMLAFDGSMFMAVICAGVIGLGMGAELDVVAYVTSRYFGLRRYGVLFGILVSIYGAGMGLGSAMAGAVVGRFGSYDPLLLALVAGCALASILVASMGRPPVAMTWKAQAA